MYVRRITLNPADHCPQLAKLPAIPGSLANAHLHDSLTSAVVKSGDADSIIWLTCEIMTPSSAKCQTQSEVL